MFKDIKNLHNNQMPVPQYTKSMSKVKKIKTEKLNYRSKSPKIEGKMDKVNKTINDAISYTDISSAIKNKSPSNRCRSKGLEIPTVYESPYSRLNRNRNNSKADFISKTTASTPMVKKTRSRMTKKTRKDIQTTVDEVVNKIKKNYKGNLLEQSHKLQNLKKIIHQKQKDNKGINKLNESIATTQNNTTVMEDKSRNGKRIGADVSFPRINISRDKYNLDKNKLSILKSHRSK